MLGCLLLICLFLWHSCSDYIYKDVNSTYSSQDAGIISPNKSNSEITSQNYIFSTNDWIKLSKSHVNVSFKEMPINNDNNYIEKSSIHNIDYPNSIKIIEYLPIKKIKDRNTIPELNLLLIHGLGGKEGDFFNMIRALIRKKFHGRINIIAGKRFDSCYKTIREQSQEVQLKLEEYLKKYSKKNKHNLVIVGHSQGGIISLSLLPNLINNPNFNICGLVLIGTPISGIDATKNYMDKQRKTLPNIIATIEKSIFGCSFESIKRSRDLKRISDGRTKKIFNKSIIPIKKDLIKKKKPFGLLDTYNDNIKKIIYKANSIIKEHKIKTKVLIGIKPSHKEFPNTFLCFMKRLCRLLDHNILHISAIKSNFSFSKFFRTIKELFYALPNMKEIFHSHKLSGDLSNDFLLSKKTQQWYLRNEYVDNVFLYGVVHNWKISILVSDDYVNRISAELESVRTISEVKKMVDYAFGLL